MARGSPFLKLYNEGKISTKEFVKFELFRLRRRK